MVEVEIASVTIVPLVPSQGRALSMRGEGIKKSAALPQNFLSLYTMEASSLRADAEGEAISYLVLWDCFVASFLAMSVLNGLFTK